MDTTSTERQGMSRLDTGLAWAAVLVLLAAIATIIGAMFAG